MKVSVVSLILCSVLLFPGFVLATGSATMNFSSTNLTLVTGKQTDIFVVIDSKGEELDTVRSVFTFDPQVIRVDAVTRVGAFDRNTPGNFIDNKNGLVSWGAFTLSGPIKTSGSVFQVTFTGLQAGKTTIVFTEDSKLIHDGQEQINEDGLGSLLVNVQESEVQDLGLSVLNVKSTSHPDQSRWYTNRIVDIDWTLSNNQSPIVSYRYVLDQSSDSDPTLVLEASQSSYHFESTDDGIFYFHLKGVQEDGKETKTIHHRIQIDTTNPNPIAMTVSQEQLIEGESLWISFATTDETSGVEQYKVAVNTSEFVPQTSPLEITDLIAGTYFMRVAAVDRAGNITNQGQSVRVYPKGTQLDRQEGSNQNTEFLPLSTSQNSVENNLFQKMKWLLLSALVIVVSFAIIKVIKVNQKK